MPRSSKYLLPGYTYHLTQRCHDRSFLLKFARDRDAYFKWLREGMKRFDVPVYGFSVTCNHVHALAHADTRESVSGMMHLASGATAKQYNLRKDREGSMWEHPFHCTLVEDGHHLLNCLCYIDLNMVRAGVVRHPSEWRWCGYKELMGERKRYRLLDLDRLLGSLEIDTLEAFRELYEEAIRWRIEKRRLLREASWSEALAVGSEQFVRRAETELKGVRWEMNTAPLAEGEAGTWVLRESRSSYGSVSAPESASINAAIE